MTTGPARRLPAPRPALRKAADAEHHPAAGPSVGPEVAEDLGSGAPEVEASDAAPARPSGQPQSAAATAFWDALQSDAAAALQRNGAATGTDVAAGEPSDGSQERPPRKSGAKKPPSQKSSGKKPSAKKKFQGATSDVLRKDKPEQDLLLGKQVSLEVRVPKRLRKAATAQAERHGTTLDNVVTGLLAGWVDGS